MLNRIVLALFLSIGCLIKAQVKEGAFDLMLKNMLQHTVEEINPAQLKMMDNVILLDCRKKEEFDISHIEGAIYNGEDLLNKELLLNYPKTTTFVTYCTIGYRSEKIAEQLKKKGYHRVYNLYGSIAAWVNNEYPVYNLQNQQTDSVHCYNRAWSVWFSKVKCVY